MKDEFGESRSEVLPTLLCLRTRQSGGNPGTCRTPGTTEVKLEDHFNDEEWTGATLCGVRVV